MCLTGSYKYRDGGKDSESIPSAHEGALFVNIFRWGGGGVPCRLGNRATVRRLGAVIRPVGWEDGVHQNSS